MLYQGTGKVEVVKKGSSGRLGGVSSDVITVTSPKKADNRSVYIGIPKCICDSAGIKKGDYVVLSHVYGKIAILERTTNPSAGYKLSYPGGHAANSKRLRLQVYSRYLHDSFFCGMNGTRAFSSPKHETKTNRIEFYIGELAKVDNSN